MIQCEIWVRNGFFLRPGVKMPTYSCFKSRCVGWFSCVCVCSGVVRGCVLLSGGGASESRRAGRAGGLSSCGAGRSANPSSSAAAGVRSLTGQRRSAESAPATHHAEGTTTSARTVWCLTQFSQHWCSSVIFDGKSLLLFLFFFLFFSSSELYETW